MMTKWNGDNVFESMGEVWFAVSEKLCGVLIAYIISDKELVTSFVRQNWSYHSVSKSLLFKLEEL